MQSYPKSIDSLHPLLVNVGFAVHNMDWNWKNVSSPFMRIYYVESGTASVHLFGKEWELTPGHLYMIPPFTVHSYKCCGHFSHYYLHIYFDHSQNEVFLENYDFPVEVKAQEIDRVLVKRLCEINPTMALPASDPATYDNRKLLSQNIIRNKERALSLQIESRGLLFQFISRFLAEAKPRIVSQDIRIQKVATYISNNVENTFTIDDLSAVACLSNDYFIRLFKKEMGQTPMQYIISKKIAYARRVLLTENTVIKSISYSLGFEDDSYFIRLFKKHTGLTPEKYRKNNLDNLF